jgi:hypothetical protein
MADFPRDSIFQSRPLILNTKSPNWVTVYQTFLSEIRPGRAWPFERPPHREQEPPPRSFPCDALRDCVVLSRMISRSAIGRCSSSNPLTLKVFHNSQAANDDLFSSFFICCSISSRDGSRSKIFRSSSDRVRVNDATEITVRHS